jgi:hypothetical protein
MDVSESIYMKRAVRQYAQQSIPEDVIHQIFNAVHRAFLSIVRNTLRHRRWALIFLSRFMNTIDTFRRN